MRWGVAKKLVKSSVLILGGEGKFLIDGEDVEACQGMDQRVT